MDNMNLRYTKNIITKDDYSKAITTSFLRGRFVDTEVLLDDQWTYTTGGNFRAKSGNTEPTYLNLFLGDVAIGDVIDFECEVYSISGYIPFVQYGYGALGSTNVSVSDYYKTTVQGEWTTIKFRTIATKNGSFGYLVGIGSSEVGEFSVRNIKLKAYMLKNPEVKSVAKETKTFALAYDKPNGVFIQKTGYSDDVVTSIINDSATSTRIQYRAFSSNNKPVVSFATDYSTGGVGKQMVIANATYPTQLSFIIIDPTTNSAIDRTTLPNQFTVYITAIA